jgi:hypothetical protein
LDREHSAQFDFFSLPRITVMEVSGSSDRGMEKVGRIFGGAMGALLLEVVLLWEAPNRKLQLVRGIPVGGGIHFLSRSAVPGEGTHHNRVFSVNFKGSRETMHLGMPGTF